MFVKAGEPIELGLQLYDGATNMHPLAYLYDNNDVQLTGSPVTLSHLANGLYINDSILMPYNIKHVKAVFKVFTDVAHTVLSEFHSDAIDVLEIGDLSGGGGSTIVAIQGIVEGSGTDGDVVGVVEAADITGAIEANGDLVGEIETLDTSGSIEEAAADGTIEDGELEGEVKC